MVESALGIFSLKSLSEEVYHYSSCISGVMKALTHEKKSLALLSACPVCYESKMHAQQHKIEGWRVRERGTSGENRR